MGFLRLSTSCAVFDDEGRVLLSLRGDLNQWNLPGGRVDAHERLPDAAAREVREETGVEVKIEQAVGLFYWQGWDRLNVLFHARPIGGHLTQRTFETRQNQFTAVDQLPPMRDAELVHAALAHAAPGAGKSALHIQTTPPEQLQRIRWALRRRYIANLLRGRPEPRHVRFRLQAVGIVMDSTNHNILLETHSEGIRLPRVICDGSAPWSQLQRTLKPVLSDHVDFQWAGLWQRTERNTVQFVFFAQAGTVGDRVQHPSIRWHPINANALDNRDQAFITQTRAHPDEFWMLQA